MDASMTRFESRVRDAFASLISAFELRRVQSSLLSWEYLVAFENDYAGLLVRFEPRTGPWVELARLAVINGKTTRIESYDLVFLLQERGGAWRKVRCESVDDPCVAETLTRLAQDVQEYATDVLQGDFSVFPRLRKRAEDNLRQTEEWLYNPKDEY
jgi:hypothetical protein